MIIAYTVFHINKNFYRNLCKNFLCFAQDSEELDPNFLVFSKPRSLSRIYLRGVICKAVTRHPMKNLRVYLDHLENLKMAPETPMSQFRRSFNQSLTLKEIDDLLGL